MARLLTAALYWVLCTFVYVCGKLETLCVICNVLPSSLSSSSACSKRLAEERLVIKDRLNLEWNFKEGCDGLDKKSHCPFKNSK